MNTCTEVHEYIDLHYLYTYIVLRYWMTCGFLYFCCNAATASTIWNQRPRNMSGTSILYRLWPLDSGWLGCQSCSFSLVMPSEEINFLWGLILATQKLLCWPADRTEESKPAKHIYKKCSISRLRSMLPGVCIPTDPAVCRSWFDPHLIMNSECIWFFLYPLLWCHLDGVTTCPNWCTLWCSAQIWMEGSSKEHLASGKKDAPSGKKAWRNQNGAAMLAFPSLIPAISC